MAHEKEKEPEAKDKKEGAAEGAEGGEDSGLEPPKKKISKMVIIAIIVGGLILVGGGVFAALYFSGALHGGAKTEHAAEGEEAKPAEGEHGAAKEESAHGGGATKTSFFTLGDLLVNLSGQGKRPNYLRVKISLELADEKDASTVESMKPRIIDDFQMYLRELRIEDLQGAAGMYRLREALLLRVTEIAYPVRVRDVLFQEMLVQ